MKNKFLFILSLFVSISLNSTASDNRFEVSNIELVDGGKVVIASDGKYISNDRKFEIKANKFIYDKEKNLLTIFDGETKNNSDNFKINFNKSTYNEINLIFSAEGSIIINDYMNNLLIKSEKIIFDRNKNFLLIEGNVEVHEIANDYRYKSEKITVDSHTSSSTFGKVNSNPVSSVIEYDRFSRTRE